MSAPRPLSLLCELTYRCNLQCPYCYNPLDFSSYRDELSTEDWKRVIREAADLKVIQIHFSGGEPTLRADLPELVREARVAGLYSNLITQGTFLDDERIDDLVAGGLDHVQISVQASDAAVADYIAGARVHERKIEAFKRVLARDVAVTLNCVLHRHNIDGVEDVIALAEGLGVRKLELANTQFYGWAYRNRAALMPTWAQVEASRTIVESAMRRLQGRMEIIYVLPDYYEDRPKPCMHGWGRAFMTVAPNGRALPCPAAASIATLPVENVRVKSLRDIWESSELFNAYRGTGWMPSPCRDCERREIDWGGCRCQAFALTGNAANTDPACELSPHHDLVAKWRDLPEDVKSFAPRRIGSAIVR